MDFAARETAMRGTSHWPFAYFCKLSKVRIVITGRETGENAQVAFEWSLNLIERAGRKAALVSASAPSPLRITQEIDNPTQTQLACNPWASPGRYWQLNLRNPLAARFELITTRVKTDCGGTMRKDYLS